MKRLLLPSVAAAALIGAGALGRARAQADDSYEIKKAATSATVGVPSKAPLTVQGKNGWHLNEQAPISVTAKAEPGLDLPKQKLSRGDLAQSTKDAARFDIPFTASAPGKKTITAEARFVMCQEQACKPMKETVALEIDVSDGASAKAAAATTAAGKALPSRKKKAAKPTAIP